MLIYICFAFWVLKLCETNPKNLRAFYKKKKLYFGTRWQTGTIEYRRRLRGRLEWPGGLWNFWSYSLLHLRGRALALWRLNRAWLGMSEFGYLNKKQGHFKLTMLCLFIYLVIYYVWALADMRKDIEHSIQRRLASVAFSLSPTMVGRGEAS